MSTKNRLAVPACCFLLLITVISCKKDKTKSPQELLLGRWDLQSYVAYTNNSGVADSSTIDMSASGYYLNFLNNTNVIIDFSYPDTSSYTMINQQKIAMEGGDTAQITLLTENKLEFYLKYIYDADSYVEDRYYYTR